MFHFFVLEVADIFRAWKLANDGDKAAIRPILDPLAAEKIEAVKIGLAPATARLGALEGFNAFEQKAQFRI